ncbi:hypothetical protein HWC59_gp29 [Proteus phage Myduc]|uniref:Uncharacterized protein n=1 Tax=Proteus phage Myduc TaxID=2650874 RepID=A0A5J6T8D2_9CAUD|nr:hypothetical protein HWC59_gp29 [Proteus phage Myduc]QFG06652.1 hypothetical protein CPT_Myduc_029 [Proteus phage Myduc]
MKEEVVEITPVPLSEVLFGKRGDWSAGYTIDSIRKLCSDSDENETPIDDLVLDMAIPPAILNDLCDELEAQHAKAGLAINHQSALINAISTAHCAMANLVRIKNLWDSETGKEDDLAVKLSEYNQSIISDCMIRLINLGLSHEEANARILRGY